MSIWKLTILRKIPFKHNLFKMFVKSIPFSHFDWLRSPNRVRWANQSALIKDKKYPFTRLSGHTCLPRKCLSRYWNEDMKRLSGLLDIYGIFSAVTLSLLRNWERSEHLSGPLDCGWLSSQLNDKVVDKQLECCAGFWSYPEFRSRSIRI